MFVSNCRQTPGCQNFLINNFTPYLTFSNNIRNQNVSLNVSFFFFFSFTQFFTLYITKLFPFFFLTSCFPEYNTSLNVVYNLIPLHIVPVRFIYTLIVFICMISLKYTTIYLVYRVQSLYCLIFFHYFPNKPTFICISVSFFLRL